MTVLLFSACSSEEPATGEAYAGPVMMELSEDDLAKCKSKTALRPVCPTRVPEAKQEPGYYHRALASNEGTRKRDAFTFSVEWGAPYRNRVNERDRPPRFSHVVVSVGDHDPFSFKWPGVPKSRCSHENPDGGCDDKTARGLGDRDWGPHPGELALAPPYPLGGLYGSHLIYRWVEDGQSHVVSLHAWRPLGEAEAALERTVESIP